MSGAANPVRYGALFVSAGPQPTRMERALAICGEEELRWLSVLAGCDLAAAPDDDRARLRDMIRALDDPATREEERRLLYVAVTRAGDRLTLSWAHQRRRNGELLPSVISSFLREVPAALVESRRTTRAGPPPRSAR